MTGEAGAVIVLALVVVSVAWYGWRGVSRLRRARRGWDAHVDEALTVTTDPSPTPEPEPEPPAGPVVVDVTEVAVGLDRRAPDGTVTVRIGVPQPIPAGTAQWQLRWQLRWPDAIDTAHMMISAAIQAAEVAGVTRPVLVATVLDSLSRITGHCGCPACSSSPETGPGPRPPVGRDPQGGAP